MSETPLLTLPLLEAAQAQKHITHNEALLQLDALLHLAVISRTLASPPASPSEGDRYLVAPSPSGEWVGHTGQLAFREAGVWRYVIPKAGWRLWVVVESLFLLFDGTTWRNLQNADVLQNMALLGVGTTADAANKLAVASAGILLTHAGSDARVKINKNAAGDTASLLFQTAYSGRAEFGLTGDDNFHIKVSPDGATWTQGILVDKTSGLVTLAGNSVDNAALADMPGATFKGRASAGSGDPEDLTGTQATAMLGTFTPGLKGLAPASGGGTTNFLRADGTWTPPPAASSAAWGAITGTLASQADLQAALNGKAPAAHTHVAADISNATTAGKNLLTAADVNAQLKFLNSWGRNLSQPLIMP